MEKTRHNRNWTLKKTSNCQRCYLQTTKS